MQGVLCATHRAAATTRSVGTLDCTTFRANLETTTLDADNQRPRAAGLFFSTVEYFFEMNLSVAENIRHLFIVI